MTKNTWTWIAVVGIFLFGAFSFWGLNKIFTPEKPVVKSDTITIVKHDTTKYAVTTFVHGGVVVHTDTITINKHDTLYRAKTPIKSKDTIWVYNQFYSTNNDSIILTDKPDLWLKLNYGISENMLVSAKVKYVNKKATQIINNNPQQPLANMLFIGGGLGANVDLFSLNGRITFKSKKNVLYTPEIEYIPVLSKRPVFKFAVQLKIW